MDKNIINYIKTSLFIHMIKPHSGYKLKDLKNYFNCQNSKEVIQKYLNTFNNPIIESYIKSNITYKTMQDLYTLSEVINKDLSILNKYITSIIDYNILYKSGMRDEIMISTGIEICPYCGRQFITRLNDRSSADLDHFYPKTYFPMLSLSLYNFIPSCQICNSRFKNQRIKKILYPFDDGYEGNAEFRIKFISPITDLNPTVEIQIENISKDKHFETNEDIKLFHIDELYQNHNRLISNLLARKRIYDNPSFKENIKNLVPHEMTEDEMNNLLFGYSFNSDYDKEKLLGKLVNDICKSLK